MPIVRDPVVEAENRAVVEALRFAGIRVTNVWDLVNARQSYETAIPVLASMLHQVTRPIVKEGIARALTAKEAKIAAPDLIREFRIIDGDTAQGMSSKWAIGNALSVTASDEVVDDIIELMRDSRHGRSRAMLPLALAHAKTKRAIAIRALIEALKADDEVAYQSTAALARLRAIEAIEPMKALLEHPDKDMRRMATKSLQRLEDVASRAMRIQQQRGDATDE